MHGLLNSYRDPKTHKIHRTFPFPPRTTLIGFAGAALGLSEDVLWDECNDLRVAVVDITKENILHGTGRAEDLVKYKKYKDSTVETSIYIRELIYKPEYMIYYASDGEDVLDQLHEAFLNPKYALSLGRDDELVMLRAIERVELFPLNYGEYGETILPFNPAEQGFTVDVNNKYFEPYSLATLPSTFTVKGAVRTPSGLQTYAFLKNLKLGIKGEGFTDGSYNFFFI
jgi:CRISPR-associated Cas5-like protein